MVKKTKKKGERDSKGRFKKGQYRGGPGRTPGTIADMLSKPGKPADVSALISDLLVVYSELGGSKFLAKWAKQNYKNLSRFVDILFRFAPEPLRFNPDSKDGPPIEFVLHDDQTSQARIRQLELLLKKSGIALPEPEKVHQPSPNKLLDDNVGMDKDGKLLVENTQDKKEPEKPPERQKTATEILRANNRKKMIEDKSWVLTGKDDD